MNKRQTISKRFQLQGLAWSEARAGARSPSSCGDPIQTLIDVVGALDCLTVLIAAIAAFYMRYGTDDPLRLDLCSTTFLAMILLFNALRAMTSNQARFDPTLFVPLEQVSKAWTFVFVILLVLAYVTRTSSEFSRAWAALWYTLSLAGFALVRTVVSRVAARWRQRGRLSRIVAIVDLAGTGDVLARDIKSSWELDIRLAGVFHAEATSGKRNGVADLVALSRVFRIDEILVTIGNDNRSDVAAILAALAIVPTTVRVCPSIPQLPLTSFEAGVFLDRIIVTVQHRPLSGMSAWAKRFEDLALSLVALVITAPLLLLIALAVRLESPGPVLFRQRRLGFNNNEFVVYKFRTMLWAGLSDTVVPQATRNDPRVTRIGRLLRRTSLDELPQLFNVLRGRHVPGRSAPTRPRA